MIRLGQADYDGRRVLITGGMGFIGSNLALKLVELNAKVTLMDSMIPSYGACLDHIASIRDRVSLNFSDMRDPHSLQHLVCGQDVIFNLAGQVSHTESMRDPMIDLDINCRSQLSLLECCRAVNPLARIVFPSTRQVYGRPQYLPVDEKHPLDPADVNGINKLAAERYFLLYTKVYGMQCVCLRLTNTYGPRMDVRNPSKGFVGVFLNRALTGRKVSVFGSGDQRRDFNHVDDVVEAMLICGHHPHVVGGSFNLGHQQHFSLREFLSVLRSQVEFSYDFVPFPAERRAIDIGDYVGDYSLFQRVTGWQPRIDLPEGITDTLRFFRANPGLLNPAQQPCRMAETA